MSAKKAMVEAIRRKLTIYYYEERELENQYERLEYINEKMVNVGSIEITDMPRNPSPSNDVLINTIAMKMDLERRIGFTIEKHAKDREMIERLLKNLGPDERAVIRMRYIDGAPWKRISEMLYGKIEDYIDKSDSYERRMFREQGTALLGMAEVALSSDIIKKWVLSTPGKKQAQA